MGRSWMAPKETARSLLVCPITGMRSYVRRSEKPIFKKRRAGATAVSGTHKRYSTG